MGRLITVARLPNGDAPNTRSFEFVTSQAFIKGAALAFSSGQVTEAGSNPASIVGFAAEAAQTKPGWQAANNPTVFTGRVQECDVFVADRSQVFSGQFVNNSSTAVAPAVADIGVSYGIKSYTVGGVGEWYVDKNLTAGNARVSIVDIDLDIGIVLFKVLEANLALP